MRVRQLLLIAALVGASATVSAAQSETRPGSRDQWRYQRPFLHFRLSPDRMRMLERSLERADRVRVRAREHSLGRLDLMRRRELAVRDRLDDRMSSLRRGMVVRERTMSRVRERLDRVREEQRVMRRRWRTI